MNELKNKKKIQSSIQTQTIIKFLKTYFFFLQFSTFMKRERKKSEQKKA